MLKTLQITSLAALVLAVCGVLLIVFLGLREDPQIIAYLEQPGVVSQFETQGGGNGTGTLKSPLVDEAAKFALRIDPPPPPAPVAPPTRVEPPKPERTVVERPTPTQRPQPPTPPVQTNAKFTLLATVLCEENPSRSMVLLRQTGGKDEWFWQGERVGHLDISEVRNGSAVFTQNGRNPQELYVPPKPQTESLLKAQADPTRARGLSTIDVRMTPEGESATSLSASQSVSPRESSDTSTTPPIRVRRGTDARTSAQEASERIRRLRTVPTPPSPEEKKAEIDNSINAIQQLMSREGDADSESRQKENEAWMKLLEAMQNEKQKLQTQEAGTGEAAPAAEAEADEAESEAGTQPAESTEAGASEGGTPATDTNEE